MPHTLYKTNYLEAENVDGSLHLDYEYLALALEWNSEFLTNQKPIRSYRYLKEQPAVSVPTRLTFGIQMDYQRKYDKKTEKRNRT